MLSDRINVRQGNQRRKKALQRAAARAATIAGVDGARAGGGLGRSRSQSRLGFLAPGLLRGLGMGPGWELNIIDDPFQQAERQPGAYDPGANDAGFTYQTPGPATNPGGQGVPGGVYYGNPGNTPEGTDHVVGESWGSGGPGTLPDSMTNGTTQGAPAGFVWYQGQLIPNGVYQALIRGGDI